MKLNCSYINVTFVIVHHHQTCQVTMPYRRSAQTIEHHFEKEHITIRGHQKTILIALVVLNIGHQIAGHAEREALRVFGV